MNVCHHAIIVRVSQPRSFVVAGDADTYEQDEVTVERFGIDEARELVGRAYRRPAETAIQRLVVKTDFITLEAQNALLKVLEEPPQSTVFLFVLPHDLHLLPTLTSRFESEHSVEVPTPPETDVLDQFRRSSYRDRLALIESALKDKNIEWQRAMKRSLVRYLSTQTGVVDPALEYGVRTLLTRGASNKMLLEQIALSLPLS